jgi:hypothetical protein
MPVHLEPGGEVALTREAVVGAVPAGEDGVAELGEYVVGH